jgi:hypothetical protein
MKTMKKVAAVLFALLLVLSSVSLGVSAEGETGTVGITITADKTTNLYPGDIVTFTINISTNFNYTAMRWPVMFTTKSFEAVVNGEGDTAYGNVRGFGTLDSAESYLESAELPNNSEAFGGTYSKTNYSGILIQWTAGTSSSGLSYYNEPNGSDCLTFQLRVKSGYTANKGVGTVAIPTTTQAKRVFYYQGITNPADLSTLYKLDTTTMTVNSTPCTVNILSANAGIQPKAGTDIVIDTSHDINYIYGFTSVVQQNADLGPTTLNQFITTTGNATYTFEDNDGGYGTGAVIHVFDADGNPVDDYSVVIFGDINGDCSVDADDAVSVVAAIATVEEWSWGDVDANAMMFACDINGDDGVYSEDFNIMELYLHHEGYPDQTRSGVGLVG